MKRENNFDLLRIIAAVMVIIIHASANYITNNIDKVNFDFIVANFFDSISRIAVPIFVMLSGGFLLDEDRNSEYIKFYKKSFNKIVKPTITWNFLYFIYAWIIGITIIKVNRGNFEIINFFKVLIFKGATFYHLWYLTMIIGLYISVPFLIIIKKRIDKQKFYYLGIFFALLSMCITYNYVEVSWKINFINYLGYFILGYSLKKKYENKKIELKYFYIYIATSLCIFFSTHVITKQHYIKRVLYFYEYNSPFVIIAAISFYIFFINFSYYGKYNYSGLSKHSFNIYLLHAGVLDVFSTIIEIKLKLNPNPIWYIPLITAITFFLCYYISQKFLTKIKANRLF